jgi:hypothetical protein
VPHGGHSRRFVLLFVYLVAPPNLRARLFHRRIYAPDRLKGALRVSPGVCQGILISVYPDVGRVVALPFQTNRRRKEPAREEADCRSDNDRGGGGDDNRNCAVS